MQLCFFEDDLFSKLHPLTLSRPIDDLRLGIMTIREKWKSALDSSFAYRIVRKPLEQVYATKAPSSDEPCLFINSRYLPQPNLLQEVQQLQSGSCLQFQDTVIVARVDGAKAREWFENQNPEFNSQFIIESQDFLSIENLWDLFQLNGIQIKRDIELLSPDVSGNSDISKHAVLQNKKHIFIGEGVTIEPGCTLIADKGPIHIGKNATIMAGSMIRGPVAIGEQATINMGAKIYGDTTIGPVCKVGGEVNNSIFHSYSNKGHDGFVGNSLIGQWCNLGADTNTSNLKNNYSPIRITDWESRQEIETDQQFFGAVLGDHTKTAINTQLNTGTICGVCCNIFSGDFPPKFVPSFSWVGSNVIQTYKIDKAFEAMGAMMARRDVKLTESYKNMMRYIFSKAKQ